MLSDFGMVIGAIVVAAFLIGIWAGIGMARRESEEQFAKRQRAAAQPPTLVRRGE